jgi:Fe-S-cluster containining protein
MPVREIPGKDAGVKCRHQCRKGCGIYERRPISCKAFACQWLLGMDTGQRPDRSHLVVDPMPDFVTAVSHDDGSEQKIAVIQVWIDPDHKDAHRDPAFRRWLDGKKRPAMIRFDSHRGFLLVPPSACSEREWIEVDSNISESEPEHTLQETIEAVGDQLDDIEIRVTP